MTGRSTTEIERQVEAQRYEVEETLDALRAKFSTGQIVDTITRTFTGAGGQGQEMLGNLGRQVKENPLPIALTGIGLAWLLMNQNKSSSGSNLPATRDTYAYDPYRTGAYRGAGSGQRPASGTSYDHAKYAADVAQHGAEYAVGQLKSGAYAVRSSGAAAGQSIYDHARYAADETKHGAEYAAGQLKTGAYRVQGAASSASHKAYDTARYAADEAKHGAKYAADQLKSGAYAVTDAAASAGQAVYDQAKFAADEMRHGAAYVSEQLTAGAYAVSDYASDAYHYARDTAYDAADSAAYYGKRAQRSVIDFVREEPLIAAALGVAVGAAIGAALPSTRTEDEYVGPYRDQLRDEAWNYASDAAERVEQVAERSFAAAEETAREEGLMPSSDEAGGKTVAEKAESVVKAARDAAEKETAKS